MKVKLKQSCSFAGKDYGLGVHTLPDPVGESWFFKAMVKDGKAIMIDAPLPTQVPVATVEALTSDEFSELSEDLPVEGSSEDDEQEVDVKSKSKKKRK